MRCSGLGVALARGSNTSVAAESDKRIQHPGGGVVSTQQQANAYHAAVRPSAERSVSCLSPLGLRRLRKGGSKVSRKHTSFMLLAEK